MIIMLMDIRYFMQYTAIVNHTLPTYAPVWAFMTLVCDCFPAWRSVNFNSDNVYEWCSGMGIN